MYETPLIVSREGTTPWNMASLHRVQTPNAPAEKDNNLHEEWHLKLIFEGHKNLDRRRESEINMYTHQMPTIRNKRAAEEKMVLFFFCSPALLKYRYGAGDKQSGQIWHKSVYKNILY
jgi:hypothetical protein